MKSPKTMNLGLLGQDQYAQGEQPKPAASDYLPSMGARVKRTLDQTAAGNEGMNPYDLIKSASKKHRSR